MFEFRSAKPTRERGAREEPRDGAVCPYRVRFAAQCDLSWPPPLSAWTLHQRPA